MGKGKVVMYKQAFFLLALVTFARSLPVKVAQGTTAAADDAAGTTAAPDAAGPGDEAPGKTKEGEDTPKDGAEGAGADGGEGADAEKGDGALSGPTEDKIDQAITIMNQLNDLFEQIVNALNDNAGDAGGGEGEDGAAPEGEDAAGEAPEGEDAEGGDPPAEGGDPPAEGGSQKTTAAPDAAPK